MTEMQTDPAPEFLTVRELAELLRIKDRKVYDLAANGAVPCTRITGKLLFPEAEIRAWIASGAHPGAATPTQPRPVLFLGSHDPLLDWALRHSRCGIPTLIDGSFDGLTRFADNQGIAAGLHIRDAATGTWNAPAVAEAGLRDAVLVGFACRERGLILRPELAGHISALPDLRGRRVVPRQAEAGSYALLAQLCAEAGMALSEMDLTDAARSETDAVQAVQSGAADATFGLRALAEPYGLPFVPLVQEPFDLLVDRKAWFDPPMQQLWAFLHSPACADHARSLAGYDVSEMGQVRWNG